MTGQQAMTTTATNTAAQAVADSFSELELDQFAQDGYLIVRQLAAKPLIARMLEVTRDGLTREIAPVEYEAELHYPGAPKSLDAEGGHTVRRLKQAISRDFCFTDWITSPTLAGRLHQLLGPNVVMPMAHHNCIMTKQP